MAKEHCLLKTVKQPEAVKAPRSQKMNGRSAEAQ